MAISGAKLLQPEWQDDCPCHINSDALDWIEDENEQET